MLCSFAHLAWSLLLQALLHEEELCEVFFRWTCCTSVRTERKFVL